MVFHSINTKLVQFASGQSAVAFVGCMSVQSSKPQRLNSSCCGPSAVARAFQHESVVQVPWLLSGPCTRASVRGPSTVAHDCTAEFRRRWTSVEFVSVAPVPWCAVQLQPSGDVCLWPECRGIGARCLSSSMRPVMF
jgi:hypothetical protein